MTQLRLIIIGILTALSLSMAACEDFPSGKAYYGPAPTECESDVDCQNSSGENWVCSSNQYCVPNHCESDTDCEDMLGPGWECVGADEIDSAADAEATYATCVEIED